MPPPVERLLQRHPYVKGEKGLSSASTCRRSPIVDVRDRSGSFGRVISLWREAAPGMWPQGIDARGGGLSDRGRPALQSPPERVTARGRAAHCSSSVVCTSRARRVLRARQPVGDLLSLMFGVVREGHRPLAEGRAGEVAAEFGTGVGGTVFRASMMDPFPSQIMGVIIL